MVLPIAKLHNMKLLLKDNTTYYHIYFYYTNYFKLETKLIVCLNREQYGM